MSNKKEWINIMVNKDYLISMFQEDIDIMLSETLGTLTNPEITELMDSLELILEGDEKIQNFIDNYKNNNSMVASQVSAHQETTPVNTPLANGFGFSSN